MPKIPECDRCRFYTHTPHLICAVFPNGPDQDSCPYFSLDPDIPFDAEVLWAPESTQFVNGELVLEYEESYYDGELTPTPKQRWTPEEQLKLLDYHPIFTGRCPNCEMPIPFSPQNIHYDCQHCGWKDDSV